MAIARVPNVPEIKQMMRHWLGNKRSLSKFAPQKRSGSLLPATIQTENCAPEYQDPRCIDNEQYYDPDLGSYVLCEVVICDTVPDPDDEFEGDDGGGGFPGGEDWGDLPEPGGGNVDVPPPNVSAADYYAMNEEERRLCRERPLHCVAYIGVSALTLGQMHLCNAFGCFQDAGFDGSPHNAVQHGLFAGMLALTPPFTPLSALEWTDAHEHNLLSVVHQVKNLGTSSLRAGGPVPLAIANNEFQCYMDAHNNRAAIHYAMMLHGLAPDYATRIALLQYWVIDNVMNNTGIFRTYAYGPFPGNSPVPPGSVHPITGQVVPGSLNWSDIGWNSLIYTFTYGEMFVDPP